MCDLTDFYQQWMANPQWRMSASTQDDTYIATNFEHLLNNECESIDVSHIILYDQLPHHVFRNQPAAHIIEYFLQKALALSLQLNTQELTMPEWIFAMLPRRHSENTELIHEVMTEAWQRPQTAMLRRFIKATYERCPKQCSITFYEPCHSPLVLDGFSHILESAPQAPPILDYNSRLNQIPPKHIILSISGGVDSMVASLPLLAWRAKHNTLISAVHINYMNRGDASLAEEEFVRSWCSFVGIPLYVRRISEAHRPTFMKHDMRDTYETYTRDVRFATYKYAGATDKDTWVCLGHNKDDCFENIMTNIAQCNKYDNLQGMTTLSIQDGITFFRPFINTPKQELYDIANTHNIPHVHNSTPIWSQRGQIRDVVKPTLQSWDQRFVSGCFELANHMRDLDHIFQGYLSFFINKTQLVNPNEWFIGISKKEMPTINNLMFWRQYIHKVTGIFPSKRSIQQLIERAQHHLHSNTKTRIPLEKRLMMTIIIQNTEMIDITLRLLP